MSSKKGQLIYPKAIKFELTEQDLKKIHEWREEVERIQGTPLEGITVSFTALKSTGCQIIVKPASSEGLRLKNIPRNDGTYDKFGQYEEIIEEYDNIGFASTPIKWDSLEVDILFCDGRLFRKSDPPKCYIRLQKNNSLIPVIVSDDPTVLLDDAIVGLFGYEPIDHEIWNKIRTYIYENMDAVLRHWNGETSSLKLLKELTPIGDK
jgi:hypothetical protein